MRIIGAGLPRTGTNSLKLALERLLGRPCYHMVEVFEHLDHVPTWHAAIRGESVDWESVLGNYEAIVDWPGGALWRELMAAYPDALVLLSTRRDATTWLASARATVLDNSPENRMEDDPAVPGFEPMLRDMVARFEPNWRDDTALLAAYDRHNAAVRSAVSPDRLVEWEAGAGWGPLCRALGVPVPAEQFPHVNAREDFRGKPDEPEHADAAPAAASEPGRSS